VYESIKRVCGERGWRRSMGYTGDSRLTLNNAYAMSGGEIEEIRGAYNAARSTYEGVGLTSNPALEMKSRK